MAWSTPSTVTTGDLITAATWNQDVVNNTIALLPVGVEFFIDGGGGAITTGIKGGLEIPMALTIDRCTLLPDQSGSIKIDIWKDTYANYPPTDADTITGGNEPEISASTKDQDSTLTSWTTSITAGDILFFNVDSCTTITWCLLSLKCSRS